eukprot:6626651-Prymnesium_polylepis.1
MLHLVSRAHLLDSRADELVLPVVVQLHHAAQQHVAGAAGLVRELASAGEDRLDVGCRRTLAPDLCQVHGVHSWPGIKNTGILALPTFLALLT